MPQNKTKTDDTINLSEDEIRLIQKLRVMKKAGRGGPPPMLLIRCVANHLQVFNAVPAGLMPIDTNARPE